MLPADKQQEQGEESVLEKNMYSWTMFETPLRKTSVFAGLRSQIRPQVPD